MQQEMLDVLEKTYSNKLLRRTTVPLFMSSPGMSKTVTIKNFAKQKGVNMIKITLSQRMPNEVVGMLFPDKESKKLEVYDSYELSKLKDGDILFFDEVFNGTLKQTLDAVLNLLEDRTLPSGKPLADVMIVAASNPQGLINLTPQIKERFIRYDLKFNAESYQTYLKHNYGMPFYISKNICIIVEKEQFEPNIWNYITPRSIEKALNQIGCEIATPYDDMLMPIVTQEIESPFAFKHGELDIAIGQKVVYLDILKFIVKTRNKLVNDTTNKKQKVRITQDLVN